MSIDITFHFKCPKADISDFIKDLNLNLDLKLEKHSEVNSWVGYFLGFSCAIFQDNDYQSSDYDWEKYDTIFLLTSYISDKNFRNSLEMTSLTVICNMVYLFKLSGAILYDDGGYLGTIAYKEIDGTGCIINLDTNKIFSFPEIENIL